MNASLNSVDPGSDEEEERNQTGSIAETPLPFPPATTRRLGPSIESFSPFSPLRIKSATTSVVSSQGMLGCSCDDRVLIFLKEGTKESGEEKAKGQVRFSFFIFPSSFPPSVFLPPPLSLLSFPSSPSSLSPPSKLQGLKNSRTHPLHPGDPLSVRRRPRARVEVAPANDFRNLARRQRHHREAVLGLLPLRGDGRVVLEDDEGPLVRRQRVRLGVREAQGRGRRGGGGSQGSRGRRGDRVVAGEGDFLEVEALVGEVGEEDGVLCSAAAAVLRVPGDDAEGAAAVLVDALFFIFGGFWLGKESEEGESRKRK